MLSLWSPFKTNTTSTKTTNTTDAITAASDKSSSITPINKPGNYWTSNDFFETHPDYFEPLLNGFEQLLAPIIKDVWEPLNSSFGFDFVTNSDGTVLIMVDMPGVKNENLNVEVVNRTINVRGERIGRINKTYAHTFPIPASYDMDSLKAELKDGLLTLSINGKPEVTEVASEPKKITVVASK